MGFARFRPLLLAAAFVLVAAGRTAASEIPNAVIVLEAPPGTPGSEPGGAPPRFVLMKDGAVFVGGTEHVQAGQLEKAEAQALRRRADAARKAAGRGGRVAFGGDPGTTAQLRLPEERADLAIAGDPSQAPTALLPVAALVTELLAYDHPSLAPYRPESYAVRVRLASRAGGCRRWDFTFPIEQALEAPRVVSAPEAASWPAGAVPASVCVGDKRYVVTLRPLLPGEQP